MTGARISTEWQYRGLRVIIIENELLRLTIMPELGAKIYDFIYKPADHNFLWHHPRIEPRAVPLGAPYDDNFSGGWDELFPNDAPGEFREQYLPDHGELWCQPWEYQVEHASADAVTLYLRRAGSVTATVIEKWITLRRNEARVHFRHRFTNVGLEPLDFLWKLHPAMAVSQHHRVDVPGTRAEYVAPGWSRLDDAELIFTWPMACTPDGRQTDLREVMPATAGRRDFLYITELVEGWCSLTDTQSGLGFGLVFPKEVFTTVWLFMTYGGWRGLHTVVLEPCTAYPKDLEAAVKLGRCGHLEPGDILECEVLAVVYEGVHAVQSIRPDGTVVTQ